MKKVALILALLFITASCFAADLFSDSLSIRLYSNFSTHYYIGNDLSSTKISDFNDAGIELEKAISENLSCTVFVSPFDFYGQGAVLTAGVKAYFVKDTFSYYLSGGVILDDVYSYPNVDFYIGQGFTIAFLHNYDLEIDMNIPIGFRSLYSNSVPHMGMFNVKIGVGYRIAL